MQQHLINISSDDKHPFEKNLGIRKGRKYPKNPPGCSVWVNIFLQQISQNSHHHSLTISIEDCNLFKKVRDNGKQVLLALKSLRNQSWKDDNIE